jgi:hypothetical protein
VLKVLFLCSAVDKNVVKLNNDKLVEKMSQDLVHHAHESAWSIRKAEWHNDPLEKAFFGFESRFPFITGTDSDLVISTFKINFREYLGTIELIKHIFKSRNGEPLPCSDTIYCSAIHTHAETLILLWH